MRVPSALLAVTCAVMALEPAPGPGRSHAAPAAAPARPIGITHVTVIDVEHGRRLRDHTVIIEDARISTVGPSAHVRVPDGYGVVEARGKFVIPGFVDLRIHPMWSRDGAVASDSTARWLEHLVLFGITTIFDASGRNLDSAGTAARIRRDDDGPPIPRVRASDRADSHVKVMTGHDGVPLTGAGFHEELRLLVEAGLTPAAALRTATFDAARALRWQDQIGSVTVGKLADLLILDASPLDDIRNTARIDAIVLDGRFIDGAERTKLLMRLAAR